MVGGVHFYNEESMNSREFDWSIHQEGVIQIEIWHLEPPRLCTLALIWGIASDKLFASGSSLGEASDNV